MYTYEVSSTSCGDKDITPVYHVFGRFKVLDELSISEQLAVAHNRFPLCRFPMVQLISTK